MNKQKAYEIINGIGGICASEEEVNQAYNVIKNTLYGHNTVNIRV